MYSAHNARSALFLVGFAIAACSHDEAKPSLEASAPSGSHESAYPSGTPLDRPPLRSQPVRPKFPCRAIDVVNKAALLPSPSASSPLAPSAAADAGANLLTRDMQIPEGDWIDIAAGAKVTAKSPRTLRETSFEGAGVVRPCVDHDEEAWMVSGAFTAVSPGNESPGAEEWVVTPTGVVRYVSSTVSIHLDKKSINVHVSGGNVSLLVPSYATLRNESDAGVSMGADAGANSWIREDAGFSGSIVATLEGDKLAAAAIDACKSAATVTKTIAMQFTAPDASIGTIGAEHTEARRLARGLCSIARVIVAKMPDDKGDKATLPNSKTSLARAVDAAEKDWRTLP